MDILNEYQDDQGKGTKIIKSCKLPIYLAWFDLGGRDMCHNVTTTRNNCSPRIHYIVKSYFQRNQISISLMFCFNLIYTKVVCSWIGRVQFQNYFFIKYRKECA